MISQCRSCTRAAWILRRIGFKDSISWGTLVESPNTPLIHAFHSNSDVPKYFAPTFEKQADGRQVKTSPGTIRVGDDPLPLCTRYRSELAWLTAGRPSRLMVYMAHPVSGNFKVNVVRATAWFQYLRRLSVSGLSELTGVPYEVKPLIQCPWLAAIEKDEFYPGGREAAIADCKDTVTLFDEIWMVGGRISDGMRDESSHAPVMRDLTHLGEIPPTPITLVSKKLIEGKKR